MKRPARESDLNQIYDIYMHESVIPFLSHDPVSLKEFLPIFQELLAGNCFFVYEVTGEVAAFYKVSLGTGRTSHVCRFGSIAVSPGYQRQGIAKIMIMEEIKNLRAKDIKRIELVVESDNESAIGFYKHLGFEIEGRLRKYYKRSHEPELIDDYIMSIIF